ncbi:MAG TPA: TIGR03620 family F420-dependent LLM class oxidoreductase [Myxococcota bacterium]|nr:TIGR03620 family F420-dependent LLM class oxidoreductase [Myxococcota bacterium]
MQLGKLGVWTWLDGFSADAAAAFAARVEKWGYGALWVPEAVGRDPFALLGFLAAKTRSLVLATGIANIYARDPMTMRATRETLGELAEGRFLLGLGVSHAHLVAGIRKHEYTKPVATMRAYLEAMDAAIYMGPKPKSPAPVVIGALRTKMLQLSAEKANGAHPYIVPPEHTARARQVLGKEALLCPEQMVLLEKDASKARAIARSNMKIYCGLPNYQNNLKWLGYSDADFADGGSDRLVDALVAWGDEKVIADRIQAHRDAGADHVCIQSFPADGGRGFDRRVLEAFAPARQ